MSSGADAAAETVGLYESLYTINDIAVAVAGASLAQRATTYKLLLAGLMLGLTAVLFFYDSILTSDREAACFWTAKRSGASFLFFANRLISMTLYVMAMVGFATLPSDQMFVHFLSRFGVVIISRVPLIVSDTLLIYITWTKLRSWVALSESKRLSLSDILFRSGTLYFVILFFLNALHLALSVSEVTVNVGAGSYVTAFTAPITAILISRFLLDLQDANRTVVRLDPDDPPLHSPLYDDTPSFISSLGGFINPDLSGRSDDSDDCELHVASSHSEAGKEEGEVVQASQTAALPSSSA
ncbi:hypothetical protein K466DRAFT_600890 [Polyporus arcularius HHB13444]|uniref:DUF6533 domain-containing protein n=1 Tax=Polyporus arcularius HHB13444 TaxID=1314778 RepID=A0A5C3PA38_9APHY|nr:hypothetical protein K466DRAFT_600890 [Polyporus arcularius HHB13444]